MNWTDPEADPDILRQILDGDYPAGLFAASLELARANNDRVLGRDAREVERAKAQKPTPLFDRRHPA